MLDTAFFYVYNKDREDKCFMNEDGLFDEFCRFCDSEELRTEIHGTCLVYVCRDCGTTLSADWPDLDEPEAKSVTLIDDWQALEQADPIARKF